jgi:AraC-like DNA-binding protein
MNFSFSEVFCIFGGLLGLIMLVVILTKMHGKPMVKYGLSMFLLIGSLIVIIGSITYSGKAIYFPHIFRLDSPLHYLFGPVCFFYTLISFKPDFKFRWIQLLNLLPFLLNLIEFTPFYFSSASAKTEHYTALFSSGSLILPMHAIIKTSISTIYLILQWVVFFKYKPDDQFKTKASRYLVSWFLIFLTTQSGMLIGLFINIFTSFRLFDDAYQYTITVEAFYLYTAAIALLFYPALLYGNPVVTAIQKEKYLFSKLSSEEKDIILDKLMKYLQSENKPFLNPEISLTGVAKLLNVNAQQLSQVINEKAKLNFSEFINSYRIEMAKEILNSPDLNKLTIDAIAEKAGFNSKSPFYIAFKKHTGMTPKAYISLQNSST